MSTEAPLRNGFKQRLELSLVSCLLGFLLGYSMAYLGRLVHIIFLDATLIGLLGGSLALFYALLRHIHPGRWLLSTCLLIGALGWYGQIYGEYRFTQRSVSHSAGDPVIETIGLEKLEPILDPVALSKKQKEALEVFERKLEEETGHRGLQGFLLYRWQKGMVALGIGPNKSRLSLPTGASAALDLLKLFLSMGLAFLTLRRLAWVKSCPECNRYLERNALSTDGDEYSCPICDKNGATFDEEVS